MIEIPLSLATLSNSFFTNLHFCSKDFENLLKNILFINNLTLMSLQNNSATYRFNLLSEERNLLNHFNEIENLILVNNEKDKIFLALVEQ